jgi:tetratricopeptide (TPR) repeat protein
MSSRPPSGPDTADSPEPPRGDGPADVLGALAKAEALAADGERQAALDQARRALDLLDRPGALDTIVPNAAPIAAPRSPFRDARERATSPAARRDLIRWRLHALLADLTGDLVHHYEAVLACPDEATSRAALGAALARAGRPREARPHLERARADDLSALGAAPAPGEAGNPEGPAPAAEAPAAPRAGRARVSLCLIVRDEEANLPACLASAAGLADEVIVVDTGSSDRTREVAAAAGARVFEFAWVDDFAAARNECLRHASGDWIFWLDADDRLDEENRGKLRALFDSLGDENVAFAMKCVCPSDAAGGSATVVDHIRLFRNHPQVRWRYRVHEQILPAVRRLGGQVRRADVVIHHLGYQDPALRRRKLERDLGLLRREVAEQPDDPFTLFNLGSVYQELGRTAEALPLLRRSLERSHPGDSIVRKLYALIVQCHRRLGQEAEALAACREGRAVYPEDVELLFQEGLALRAVGDRPGAEASLRRLLEAREGDHFASVDPGLRGYKARHNLAVLCHEQGRAAEAEAQWRAAVAERPDFTPAWVGLGELYLAQDRWADLEPAAHHLETTPAGAEEAALLRARGHLKRREFEAARRLMEGAIARSPQSLRPRVILSHALLQEGRDHAAAERALRDILALDPLHAEARHNLAVLLASSR